MTFLLSDTFTDSLAKLIGAAQLLEVREMMQEVMVPVYVPELTNPPPQAPSVRSSVREGTAVLRRARRVGGRREKPVCRNRNGTCSGRSFNGPEPRVQFFESEEEERDGVANWIRARLDEGLRSVEIGIFVRSEAQRPGAEDVAQALNLTARDPLENSDIRGSVSTMSESNKKLIESFVLAVNTSDWYSLRRIVYGTCKNRCCCR